MNRQWRMWKIIGHGTKNIFGKMGRVPGFPGYAVSVERYGKLLQAALIAIGLMVLFFQVNAVWANDSTARVATGGITFTKNDNIRMVEEFLEISRKTVRVKYRFRNESTQDIDTTVAFPMPPYDWAYGASADDQNIRAIADFKVLVNGHSVSTSNIVEATIGDRNITKRLKEIGLSDAQIANHAGCHMDAGYSVLLCDLSIIQRNMLMKEFTVDDSSLWHPPWKVTSTIIWKQLFPAGQDVIVEHTYTPFVGNSYRVFSPTSAPGKRFVLKNDHIPAAEYPYDKDNVCLDDNTRKAMETRVMGIIGGKNPSVLDIQIYEENVEYILGTGRNWKGPIGKFTLRIKKETPEQFVSLCFPGKPKKVDSITYEFTQKDFVPQDRLLIYFYEVSSQGK